MQYEGRNCFIYYNKVNTSIKQQTLNKKRSSSVRCVLKKKKQNKFFMK